MNPVLLAYLLTVCTIVEHAGRGRAGAPAGQPAQLMPSLPAQRQTLRTETSTTGASNFNAADNVKLT